MAGIANVSLVPNLIPPPRPSVSRRHLLQHSTTSLAAPPRLRSSNNSKLQFTSRQCRIRCFQQDASESFNSAKSEITSKDGSGSFNSEKSEIASKDGSGNDIVLGPLQSKTDESGNSFLSILGIFLGIAAVMTLVSISIKQPSQEGTMLSIQNLMDGSYSSTSAAPAAAFSFKAFGYRVALPQYAPGWVYFWLLMAAACGLFISEEALNIWVGTSLARLLTLDGTWQSLIDSFSKNASYIISTMIWIYWGVCISDMIPFYLGRFFRQSKASDDIISKLGVGKEKAMDITHAVQKYGNLIGFVERFSIGVRNPTAFLAGATGISPECFFAGVCCGGLVTFPIQLGIGFLLRERPVFALATVATVVGLWTLLPYAVAAMTALFLYVRRRYSS